MTRRYHIGLESEEANFFDDTAATAGADSTADTDAPVETTPAEDAPSNQAVDLTDLNVQQLHESETAKLDGELKQMWDDSRSVHKAAQDIEVINAAMEAYKSEYKSGKVGRIRTAYLEMKTTVDPIIYRNQLTPLPAISMESEVVEYYQVSMESISTLIHELIDRVLAFFSKVIDWIKRTYSAIVNSTAILKSANSAAWDTFKKWRALNGEKVFEIAEKKGLLDTFCELPNYKKYLTNLGRQPGTIDHSFEALLVKKYGHPPADIVNSYAAGFIDYDQIGHAIGKLLKAFDKNALIQYHIAVTAMVNGQPPRPMHIGFNPITDVVFMDDTKIDYGYTVGADGKRVKNAGSDLEHTAFLNGYLGDLICASSYAPVPSKLNDTYEGQIGLLKSWEFKLSQDPDAEVRDSSMRYIRTHDALEGFSKMDDLLHGLADFRKSKDDLEVIILKFRAMIEELRNCKRFTPDANYSSSAAEETSRMMVLTVEAFNKTITNLASTFTPWTSGVRNLSVAWYYYIKATLEREKELLAAK